VGIRDVLSNIRLGVNSKVWGPLLSGPPQRKCSGKCWRRGGGGGGGPIFLYSYRASEVNKKFIICIHT
jgi:hypothetical protein